MTQFRVWFTAIASHYVDVEAGDREEAIDNAVDEFSYPPANVSNEFELGQWAPETDITFGDISKGAVEELA